MVDLQSYRRELAKIPAITAEQARKMAAELQAAIVKAEEKRHG